jgi:hypothetical protein
MFKQMEMGDNEGANTSAALHCVVEFTVVEISPL